MVCAVESPSRVGGLASAASSTMPPYQGGNDPQTYEHDQRKNGYVSLAINSLSQEPATKKPNNPRIIPVMPRQLKACSFPIAQSHQISKPANTSIVSQIVNSQIAKRGLKYAALGTENKGHFVCGGLVGRLHET